MEYMINHKQLDNLMKSYWDMKFNGCEIDTIEEYSDDEDWEGIVKNEELLVGHMPEDSDTWFIQDEEHFDGGHELFGITSDEFNESMRRYLNNNFDLSIDTIM